jgi:hypothetical protein
VGQEPISTNGRAFAESTVGTFQSQLRGTLLRPEDNAYDTARKVFNAMIDQRPTFIARCASASNVVTCVQFARDHELLGALGPSVTIDALREMQSAKSKVSY